jgi:hypothetical protein
VTRSIAAALISGPIAVVASRASPQAAPAGLLGDDPGNRLLALHQQVGGLDRMLRRIAGALRDHSGKAAPAASAAARAPSRPAAAALPTGEPVNGKLCW